ncbi:guanidinobutyrase-like isoform X2 [Oscarella lobularis]
MMRLPHAGDATGLDACFLGIPFDVAVTNRAGTRHGPRQIRNESSLLRPFNAATGAAPFESIQVADVGDVAVNTHSIADTFAAIEERVASVTTNGCVPLVLGGDHSITHAILRGMAKTHGKVALVHVDAHCDTADYKYITHGTPFRRAVEEDLLVCDKVWQIGLRGGGYTADDFAWGSERGFHVVQATDCWHKSLAPLMERVRDNVGDTPVYISFDIDALDPGFAPGTGTPEIGGLTPIQALEIIRGCRGLNIVGGDLVEVSPPYDASGNTALLGANLLFEMLCVLPKVKYTPIRSFSH